MGRQLLAFAIPFIGVGAGVVTVVLLRSPKALIPPPWVPWLFVVGAIVAFSMVLAMGLVDGWAEDDRVDTGERWRAALLAYVAGVAASATFVAAVALLHRLD